MSKFIYIQSEKKGQDNCIADLWTVGFYDPSGEWHAESDHETKERAIERVAYLNGGSREFSKKAFNHKHTEGDWLFQGGAIENGGGKYSITSKDGNIATIWDTVIEGEALPNAKLIVNAPKLLEVAEMYYDSIKGKNSIAKTVVEELLREIGVID